VAASGGWCIDRQPGNSWQTIRSIGEDHWAAACSDSTNVTKAARRETVEEVTMMLDLRDCNHHLQLTIKDITNLVTFKFVRLISLVLGV
jgi:hypothetical protein